MANPFTEAAESGLQFGQSLAAPNPLAIMIRGILGRAQERGLLREKVGLEVAGQVAVEREKARIQQETLGKFLGGGGPSAPGTSPGLGGAVPTEFEMGGMEFSLPGKTQQIAAEAQAREEATRMVKVAPVAKSFIVQLKQFVDLSRQVPAPSPGLKRPFQALSTQFRGSVTQELPQLVQANRKREAAAGQLIQLVGGETSARLSDFDVRRALGLLSNPAGDTADTRVISFLDLIDALNAIPEVQQGLGGVNPSDVLFPEEVLRGRELQGRSGGKVLQDAQGNLAIEYPDGTVEEL